LLFSSYQVRLSASLPASRRPFLLRTILKPPFFLSVSAATAGQHFPSFDFNTEYTWPDRDIDSPGSRISVGFEASAGDFPSIAAVYLPSALCGGTLIAPNAVLTAAHCTAAWPRKTVIEETTIYIGLLSRNNIATCNGTNGCETRKIKDLVVHPNYNQSNPTTVADIAILILDTPSTITPAPMAKTKPTAGKVHTIAGWGIMASSQMTAIRLMYTDIKIVPDADCEFDANFYDAKGSICSISTGSWPNNYTASACQGDSGGPLYNMKASPPELLGSVSYGVLPDPSSPCGRYIRTVSMSVSAYSKWIESVLAKNPLPPPPPALPPPSPVKRPPPPSPTRRCSPPPPRRRHPPSRRRRPPPPKKKKRPPPGKQKKRPPPRRGKRGQ